jgi:hypothetical protein
MRFERRPSCVVRIERFEQIVRVVAQSAAQWASTSIRAPEVKHAGSTLRPLKGGSSCPHRPASISTPSPA